MQLLIPLCYFSNNVACWNLTGQEAGCEGALQQTPQKKLGTVVRRGHREQKKLGYSHKNLLVCFHDRINSINKSGEKLDANTVEANSKG